MNPRYQSMLQSAGRIAIPAEICNRQQFRLRPGDMLKKSIDRRKIVLYTLSGETAGITDGVCHLDEALEIILPPQYLEQLHMKEGEPLYFSIVGDLITIEKASCEACSSREQLVEYSPCQFRCKPCITRIIRLERERGR